MVSHPNRSQKSLDALIRRLLNKYELNAIDIRAAASGITVRAMPLPYGKLVMKRREHILAGVEGDISLSRVSALTKDCASAAVATGVGNTIDAAIADLAANLSTAAEAA